MTEIKQRAINMISRMPEQKALEDLQRFRKRSDVEIDCKAELAKAREEKYAVWGDDNESNRYWKTGL